MQQLEMACCKGIFKPIWKDIFVFAPQQNEQHTEIDAFIVNGDTH